jgi:hypothetical protein
MTGESPSSNVSDGTAALRLRQAVLAAADLDAIAGALRSSFSLGQPFADEGVGYFGLRNAVFALGDTFLEVVSPVRDGTSAGRLIERRGGDCGYMLMFQVPDLAAARARAAERRVRTVFEITLDDIDEVHLHPADMHGAIVALSQPSPPASWRWGGPDWPARAARSASVAGAVVGVRDPAAVAALWTSILGGPAPGVSFIADPEERGLVEIRIDVSTSADAAGTPGPPDAASPGPIAVGTARVTALPNFGV